MVVDTILPKDADNVGENAIVFKTAGALSNIYMIFLPSVIVICLYTHGHPFSLEHDRGT
jgi:hypothetical protein